MKISYAITVCNEREEIERLISFLLKHKREEDEIVVQQDLKDSPTKEESKINYYLTHLENEGKINFILSPLNKDFAQFKNHLNQHCTGDYIFQIDADEIPNEFLIENLPFILKENGIDLIYVPRVNTVEGLTYEHVQKWRWNVNEKGWINWPDQQSRIYKNSPEIRWEGKVHEKIVGVKTITAFPNEEVYALYHPKQIERQEKQNEFYETI
jgi:glycosyltransferase involved in cell wall biosynthesis